MTIHRWLNDPDLNFPRPVYIGRYRYWVLEELLEWEGDQARRPDGRYSRTSGMTTGST
jgi:predicted DNA-binding transcriptional regulator AlpA